MKVVQMTLDDSLVKKVDRTVKKLKTTRSAFTRNALKHEIELIYSLELEKRQIEGYKKKPVKINEFDVWEDEQAWVD